MIYLKYNQMMGECSMKKKVLIPGIITIAALYVLQVLVANISYKDRFMPGTIINTENKSIDASGKTKGDVVDEHYKNYLPSYPFADIEVPYTQMLTKTPGGYVEDDKANFSTSDEPAPLPQTDIPEQEVEIKGIMEQIDIGGAIKPLDESELDALFNKQRYLGYLSRFFNPSVKVLSAVDVETGEIEELLKSQSYLSSSNLSEPVNAYINYNEATGKYEIVPEDNGFNPDVKKVAADMAATIENSSYEPVVLMDYSKKAEVTEEDKGLNTKLEKLNSVLQAVITYDILDNKEVLSSKTYKDWITYNEDGTHTIDRDKAVAYVDSLREKYNTAYTSRKFKTHYGDTIDITGPYGYAIGQQAETDKLLEDIEAGNIVEREPEWYLKGNSNGVTDWGDSYVEVSITNQHVFLYKDGELILDTDCVTGIPNAERATHPGIFPITYKAANATLKGPGYASFVHYWMPFDGGIGLHDATWRGSFGGKIYKTNGSHGCVNLPLSKAKTIYENVEQGMAVIVY